MATDFDTFVLPNGEEIDLRGAAAGVMEAFNRAFAPKPITIENLKAAGFDDWGDGSASWYNNERPMESATIYRSMSGAYSILEKGYGVLFDGIPVYPESMADIEALKRMLTPK